MDEINFVTAANIRARNVRIRAKAMLERFNALGVSYIHGVPWKTSSFWTLRGSWGDSCPPFERRDVFRAFPLVRGRNYLGNLHRSFESASRTMISSEEIVSIRYHPCFSLLFKTSLRSKVPRSSPTLPVAFSPLPITVAYRIYSGKLVKLRKVWKLRGGWKKYRRKVSESFEAGISNFWKICPGVIEGSVRGNFRMENRRAFVRVGQFRSIPGVPRNIGIPV